MAACKQAIQRRGQNTLRTRDRQREGGWEGTINEPQFFHIYIHRLRRHVTETFSRRAAQRTLKREEAALDHADLFFLLILRPT